MNLGITLDIDVPSKNLRDSFNVSVSLADLQMSMGLVGKVDVNRLNELKVPELATRECFITAVDQFELYGQSLNIGAFEAVIQSRKDGKGMQEIFNGTETTALINQAIKQVS